MMQSYELSDRVKAINSLKEVTAVLIPKPGMMEKLGLDQVTRLLWTASDEQIAEIVKIGKKYWK